MTGEPWLMRCPEGHSSYTLRTRRGVIYCESCDRDYHHKRNMKTDRLEPVMTPGRGEHTAGTTTIQNHE